MTARRRVYLSAPTAPADVILKARARLESLGMDVVMSAHVLQSQPELSVRPAEARSELMRRNLARLATLCDAVVYLPDWEDSNEAILDLYVATALAMPRVSIEDSFNLRRLARGDVVDPLFQLVHVTELEDVRS